MLGGYRIYINKKFQFGILYWSYSINYKLNYEMDFNLLYTCRQLVKQFEWSMGNSA